MSGAKVKAGSKSQVENENKELTIEQRLELLATVPVFACLPDPVLAELAAALEETRYLAGSLVISEGTEAEGLYLMVEGSAEVTVATRTGPLILASLEAGELFGEMAFFNPTHTRQATVTALSPLVTLALTASAFENLLATYPASRQLMEAVVEEMKVSRFLKQLSPFSKLNPAQARHLAACLKKVNFEAGEIVIREGETGDSCYLIYTGQVEVLAGRQTGDGERQLSILRAGALFGEAALLTAAPRNATVRALENCEMLFLDRADFLATLAADRKVGLSLLELLQLRTRPRAVKGVITQPQATSDGETIIVLKNPHRQTYYRLSPQGWFIWQRLDGQHTVRDLALDYLAEFKSFAPAVIADVISGLAAAGFLDNPEIEPEVARQVMASSGWKKWLLRLGRILTWRFSLKSARKSLDRLYRGGLWLLYIRPVQGLLGIIGLLGLAAFFLNGRSSMQSALVNQMWWILIPAYLLSIILHEAGHAFTTLAFGREIHKVGVGWYWFTPVAYVDTTDMWLERKWPRILVSLAGPYTNFLLGSLAALLAWVVGPSTLSGATLGQFALTSYLMVILNLNPLLDFDGYYALSDWLEQPNLRQRSFKWFFTNLKEGKSKASNGIWEGHTPEKVYLSILLLYLAGLVLLLLLFNF